MKRSEFEWYASVSSQLQELRRGGLEGPVYAAVSSEDGATWVVTVNMHQANAVGTECNSELEAILNAEMWLEEAISGLVPL